MFHVWWLTFVNLLVLGKGKTSYSIWQGLSLCRCTSVQIGGGVPKYDILQPPWEASVGAELEHYRAVIVLVFTLRYLKICTVFKVLLMECWIGSEST